MEPSITVVNKYFKKFLNLYWRSVSIINVNLICQLMRGVIKLLMYNLVMLYINLRDF
jgi:hypothetical protein